MGLTAITTNSKAVTAEALNLDGEDVVAEPVAVKTTTSTKTTTKKSSTTTK